MNLQNGKTNTSEVVERGTPQAKTCQPSYEVVEQDGKTCRFAYQT